MRPRLGAYAAGMLGGLARAGSAGERRVVCARADARWQTQADGGNSRNGHCAKTVLTETGPGDFGAART